MDKNTLESDQFACEYQKHFLRSYIVGMPERKLRKVAMYHFLNSRIELANRTADLISGDRMLFNIFLESFPLSWRENLAINTKIMQQSLRNAQDTRAYRLPELINHNVE